MRQIITGKEFGTLLCQVFGFSPDEVGKITIVCAPDDVARVIVEMLVREEEAGKIVKLLKNYALAEEP